MAIIYSTLFARVGKFVKAANAWIAYQAVLLGMGTGADEILSQFETRRDLVAGVLSQYTGYVGTMTTWSMNAKTSVDALLADLQGTLIASSKQSSTILPLLLTDMTANGQTVKKNTVVAPIVTAGSGNTGNASLLASHLNASNAPDERIINETVIITCTGDVYSNSRAGAEPFKLTGLPTSSPGSYLPPGNGQGPTINVANESGSNKITNGNFDAFTIANTPDNWTIAAGVPGTTILKENTIVHSATSTSSLRMESDGTSTTITLSQLISNLKTGSKFVVGSWVRSTGTFSGTSNLQIAVEGTGFATVNLFNGNPSTLTGTFALKSAFFNMGSTIPSDMKLVITWTGVNLAGAGASILIDDVAIVAPTVFGNVSYVLFRGSTDPLRGDNYTVATANDYAGVIQTFFGNFYGVQLPSATSGSETISDSLAE